MATEIVMGSIDEPEYCEYKLIINQSIRVEFQAGCTQLVRSTGANVSVMVLQDCKSTPQKSRPIESGHGRHMLRR